MKTITPEFVQELIDFAPTERAKRMGFAEAQQHGAVAAFNMLMQNQVAYIADEVGMGKTYIALAIMSLLRYQLPSARIVVLAPRENIQFKWIKELRNFVRDNWRYEDNRVKSLHGTPVWTPIACGTIGDIPRLLRVNDHLDLFLRSTTFQLAVGNQEGRQRCRRQLLPNVPWIKPRLLKARDPLQFRDMYGRVLNALIPEIDLLVVDEAHNFKHGFGDKVSNRNRILGMALGHPNGNDPECPWYAARVKRVLMLSATPFEYDYADLYRQLDVFGFGNVRFTDSGGGKGIPASRLRDDDDESIHRELVRRFLIRRVQYLKIAGRPHSKNMYRREWRLGGYEQHDDPMALTDPKQRLVVGLIQKKVAEILGDRRFNNNFQIGMLSSFESFMESIARSTRTQADLKTADDQEEDAVFDGNQETTRVEKQGLDSHSLETVIQSYRERFGRGLPHPKLDATAISFSEAFKTGEKALIFVRRIATVSELRSKLNAIYDDCIQQHMKRSLPDLIHEIDGIFQRYGHDKRGRRDETGESVKVDEEETVSEEQIFNLEEDEGGTDSFFAWFFRGEGPKRLLSGAAFQKNRLTNVSSSYATIFEDDHVAWLLGNPLNVIEELCRVSGIDQTVLIPKLRKSAYAYFLDRTRRRDGYPRLYVFEAYQVAALLLLADGSQQLSEKARVILHERYRQASESPTEPPQGFPDPDQALGVQTFFTALAKHDELRRRIWPEQEKVGLFRDEFRRREQRRELLSSMARLGAAYIDLYLLAIGRLKSFELRSESSEGAPVESLINDYIELLESQMHECDKVPTFNAFRELSEAADAFDTLVAVNFPEVRDAQMSEFATIFSRALQHQEPVGRMFGGVNKRLVKQFRMPGYPLVLATTDVLQEGEDLHTFCRRVVHYGITWTPSAMEQRTGRVDRIGSLAQRRLDGRDTEAQGSELIQVYYPHLSGTVERLQVRRVLQRLNQFLRLIHKAVPGSPTLDSKIDVAREILQAESEIPRIEGLLVSDFPVGPGWLSGELRTRQVSLLDLPRIEETFRQACNALCARLGVDVLEQHQRHSFGGRLAVVGGCLVSWTERLNHPRYREQPFELLLRSQTAGGAMLVRCISPVGKLDLRDNDIVDGLYELQRRLGMIRVCARFIEKDRLYDISVEMDRLFHVDTTQQEEIEDMVIRTVIAADQIEAAYFDHDMQSDLWVAARHVEDSDE